jgi:hypothetical protein
MCTSGSRLMLRTAMTSALRRRAIDTPLSSLAV